MCDHCAAMCAAWTIEHPGNSNAQSAGRPNPIRAVAAAGATTLRYPAFHPMQDWDRYSNARGRRTTSCRASTLLGCVTMFEFLGRFGDEIDFVTLPSPLQTPQLAERWGAIQAPPDGGASEACGSPGEVANEPVEGNARFLFQTYEQPSFPTTRRELLEPAALEQTKFMVWAETALHAADQLRQRTAWALSQIIVVSAHGIAKYRRSSELWLAFYDVLVRHAFGSFTSLLREVAYSPVMATYLTFLRNRAYSNGGTYPDENFAREAMQLFSIGLVQLEQDGTPSQPQTPTYDNHDILDGARVWTGFDAQPFRGNLEAQLGARTPNFIDPMRLRASWRDPFPKMGLGGGGGGGYLGDGYPLCTSMPPRSFLRRGARYVYLGGGPSPTMHDDDASTVTSWLTLDAAQSTLFQALCHPAADGVCTHAAEVTLDTNLACHGAECNVETARVVRVVSGGTASYWEFVNPSCVHLTFYGGGRQVSKGRRVMCANPQSLAAGAACCASSTTTNSQASAQCVYPAERVTFGQAEQRCASGATILCHRHREAVGDCGYAARGHSKRETAHWPWTWLRQPCTLRVRVKPDGTVVLVHTMPDLDSRDEIDPRLVASATNNAFRVAWIGGVFPTASPDLTGTGGDAWCDETACVASGSACVCDVTIVESAVFTSVPTRTQVLAQLTIGATPPVSFDDGVYLRCVDAACAAMADVEVYLRSSGAVDADTIFGVRAAVGTATVYLANKNSTVSIGESYAFRNPPSFMSFVEPTARDATHETDAFLDHLVRHDNTAPFLATRFIQRLVTCAQAGISEFPLCACLYVSKYPTAVCVTQVKPQPAVRARVLGRLPLRSLRWRHLLGRVRRSQRSGRSGRPRP